MTQKHPFYYLFVSLVIVILDQVSKYIVRLFMPVNDSIPVLGEFFCLTHVQNPGAAFSLSLGSDGFNRVFFGSVAFIMIFVILFMLKKSKSAWEKLSYSLIIGGAIGNLTDRIILGAVTDFLDFDFPDFIMNRWPVFNVADSSIVVAVVLLLFYVLFIENRKSPEAK